MKRPVAFILKTTTPPNYYKVLGVAPVATVEQIKTSYYALARQHHPDHGGKVADMAALTEAYAVLGDAARRKVYDAKRKLLGRPCSACKGAGVTYRQRSFTKREAVACRVCGGSGAALEDV